MSREVSPATTQLQDNWTNFAQAYEEELRFQATKQNASSERRMRKLLRSFTDSVYVPYRDATLESRQEESPLPF